jgi:hypothetical protein
MMNACTPPQGYAQWAKAPAGSRWPVDKVVVATFGAGSGCSTMHIEAAVQPLQQGGSLRGCVGSEEGIWEIPNFERAT